jgi:uncharacterized protein YlaN (UPF0358 family)
MTEGDREKIRFTLTTNLRGEEVRKSIDMRLNSRLLNFIELYEELFEIDLYAYRLKFIDRNTGKEVNTLNQVNRDKGEPRVELFVEAPGG